VDHLAEHLAAAWQSDQRHHLSHSRSALPDEPVGDDQLVPELTGTVDQARPVAVAVAVAVAAVERVGSVAVEHTAAAVFYMRGKD
jgi:hypothetical protein